MESLNKVGDPYFIASLFALILFLIGLMNILKRKRYKKSAISTIGEVEGLIEEIGSNRNIFYPLISFVLPGGKTVVYKSDWGTYPSAYQKHQKVKVLFLPENPENFIIDDNKGYFYELLFLIIGLLGFFSCITIFLINIL